MKYVTSAVLTVAAMAFVSMAAFAQTSGQSSSAQSSAASSSQDAQQVTVVGCIQSESDYRRAKDAGRGGVAGSGVGAGNEFILADASISKSGASESAAATSGSSASTPTGTGGSGASANAFELTGENEAKAAQHVGKRVEITGKLKPGEVGASGATGGATAGAPPSGVDVASKDLKLRELEITSIRETSGSCPSSRQ
jgi:hypothetical protein